MASADIDTELRKTVQKDSSDRLQQELKLGQTIFDDNAIIKLSRPELISYVTALRKLAGQTTAVRSVVPGFDPSKVTIMASSSIVSAPASAVVAAASDLTKSTDVADSTSLMSAMMQMMAMQMEERRLAAAANDAKLKKEEDDRREAAAERREAAEERRLAREIAAEDRRLSLATHEARMRKEEQDRQAAAEERRLTVEALRVAQAQAELQRKIDADVFQRLEEERHKTSQEQIKMMKESADAAAKRHDMDQARADRLEAKSREDSSRKDIRLKRAHDVMKGVLYPMPSEANDLTLYFENVDRLFDTNEVGDDLRISLLTPFLTERARRAMLSLSSTDCDTYEHWKQSLLREHRLTSLVYKQNFYQAVREPNESCLQFSTRLSCLLKYYLESRKISNSYDDLVALLLSDRLKESLSANVRYHISDKEGVNWFKSVQISELVDLYESERGQNFKNKTDFNNKSFYSKSDASSNRVKDSYSGASAASTNPVGETHSKKGINNDGNWKSRMRCRNCLKLGHLAYECRKGKAQPHNVNYDNSKDGSASKAAAGNTGVLRRCYLCSSSDHVIKNCPEKAARARAYRAQKVSVVDSDDSKVSNNKTETKQKTLNIDRVHFVSTDSACVDSVQTKGSHKFSEQFISVDFGKGPVKCIVDSGAEISVLKSNMVPLDILNSEFASTSITLQGAFGQRAQAKLLNLSGCLLINDNVSSRRTPVLLTCAISDELSRDVALISSSDYVALQQGLEEFIPEIRVLTGTSILYDNPRMLTSQDESRLETVIVNKIEQDAIKLGVKIKSHDLSSVNLGIDLARNDAVNEYRADQLSDSTLKDCWGSSSKEGSDFVKRSDNQLLYRHKVIGGFKIAQLVLPLNKRQTVMKMAHDSEWAMHFGILKTTQRIEAHFYWPSMSEDIKNYVKGCIACQKHARKTKLDRVPITPVVRATASFEQVNIDLIGPLNPKSSRGHQYILCLIDSCTRWVEAVPLRTLTARELCDALLSIFCRIGLPRILISDNGTNMVAGLTLELYQRLGIQLRCSTPYHPEGNSLVERFNQSLKRMLHHILNSDSPRDWDRKLPYLLWAYREIPNATTGLSPYQLVYGRLGRGPLSILRDTWSDDQAEIPIVNGTILEYLDKLKADLEVGLDLAEENAGKAQNAYAHQYNTRSKDKGFEVGDLVLVLMPDSTNKVVAQWQGPGTITAVMSPYSYRVALDTGAVKTLHANDLRKFVARVNSVGVVFDDDTDFGRIECCPVAGEKRHEEINALDLTHLSVERQQELRSLLFKHENVFNDKPGQCNSTCHEINLEKGFKPKSMRPYRIPEKLKSEVDKQIDQLLKDGKIRPSSSPYSHPIVCVAKSNGEVRMCTDLRYINSGTINDAYPMPRSEDLLLNISAASYISTLDCTSGYWQIPMRECDVMKTAFCTHRGLYEWLVMPFGVKTASNTFQRVIDDLLRPHSSYANAYIDDTAVHSLTWSEHLQHLDNVLYAFDDAGMTLRLSKCKFAQPKVKFIGHEVGSGKRSVVQSKVEAIKAISEPHTKKLLRSFLGMCAFYRNYIPNYSEIALPLTELTKNRFPNNLKFDEKQRAAFLLLKAKLCETTSLFSPRMDMPFIVRTDASDYAVGASVSQIDEYGTERPVAFASAKLTEVQCRWSTIEKEAYAVIFALNKFDTIVFGCHIDLFTDHNPLQYLAACAPKSAKLTRWALSLTRYDISVTHIHGKDNVTADCLSRC